MKAQRGLAAVTAILVVAVAASAATLMLSQQSAMLDQTAMVAARVQADAYAQAGIDWARGVLVESQKRSPAQDSLDQPWARPIAALPVERAVVGGILVDEQGKLDLNGLASGNAQPVRDTFRRLLESLALSPDLADAVTDWVDPDDSPAGSGGAEDAYYLSLPRPYRAANGPMAQIEELYRVRGFDAAGVAKLRPYVTALPGTPGSLTAVNVNTAPAAVLQALMPAMSADKVAALVASRAKKPFATREEFMQRIGQAGVTSIAMPVDVRSSHFAVRINVAQDDVQVATEALLARRANGGVDIIWRRPRY